MLDLLVIGAGLSGLMTAHTAAKAGKKVKVVAKGLGNIHWSAATVGVLGYLPGAEEPVKRPFSALDQLLANQPAHPYALLGEEKIQAALDSFLALTKEIGLPYGGAANAGDNLLLPSPAGAKRPVFLAPAAQLAGDLSRSEPMVIVGFSRMRDFYPELIADNLSKQGYPARAAFLPFELLTDRKDSTTIHLAEELDDPNRRKKLAGELKKIVKKGERIGLPAVLGMNAHTAVLQELSKTTGAPVFEIPTMPPSVPGVRLYKALRRHLQSMGVRIEAGMEVIDFDSSTTNGTAAQVSWVATETSARPLRHRAERFLLATGGVLGGGFNSDISGRVWEVIFDLPLTAPQKRTKWFRASFLAPEGHPVFNGGVTVNAGFQPTNGDGQPLYHNLWAAGNLLAHSDPILERSLEGAAIATGVAAAQAIASE